MNLKQFLIKNSLKWLIIVSVFTSVRANPDAKRLYDDLLSNYNRLIRPVSNNTDTVLVKLGLRLSQLIDLVSKCLSILKYCQFDSLFQLIRGVLNKFMSRNKRLHQFINTLHFQYSKKNSKYWVKTLNKHKHSQFATIDIKLKIKKINMTTQY